MPTWARDAQVPVDFCFLDLVLEVSRHYGWTPDYCLAMPVRRWWLAVDHLRRHREEMAQAAKENPLAGLALLLGR